MNDSTARLAARAGFWGRVIAVFIGLPIYFALLPTLPAVAAVLITILYFGVPVAVRRAVTDPVYDSPTIG